MHELKFALKGRTGERFKPPLTFSFPYLSLYYMLFLVQQEFGDFIEKKID